MFCRRPQMGNRWVAVCSIGMQVERSVELPAEPDEVWEALTDDELLAEWLGDGASLDPTPGGGVSVSEDDGVRRGVVEEVDEGRRLSFTWWPDGDPGAASRVSFDLVTVPAGTRVLVVERPLEPAFRFSATTDARMVMLAATSCLASTRIRL